MKQCEKICFLFVIFILFPTLLHAHGGIKHDEKKIQIQIDPQKEFNDAFQSINSEYLKTVKPIFKNSCFDCHSNKTRYPWYSSIPGIKQFIESDINEAFSHLDFSPDFPFKSHEAPKKDLESIRDSIEKERMPPWNYSLLHWKNKPSKEEIKSILDWTNKSLDLIDSVKP